MWIFLSLLNPLELSFPVIYWCLPAQACLAVGVDSTLWVPDDFLPSLASETDYSAKKKKRQKQTLTNPHPMYGMTQFLWIGEVLQIRDEFVARLLLGKADYMKSGMANKLNGVKPELSRGGVEALTALSSSLPSERAEAQKQPLWVCGAIRGEKCL